MTDPKLENLYREIDAMGGTVRPDDEAGNARMALLLDVLTTLAHFGITEGKVDAVAGNMRIICVEGKTIAVPNTDDVGEFTHIGKSASKILAGIERDGGRA